MSTVIARYRVKPGRVAENVELVRAVYEELHAAAPEGFRYATFRLDERSFIHLAILEGDGPSPLSGLSAFQAFTRDSAERCEEPPVVTEVEQVGAYRL